MSRQSLCRLQNQSNANRSCKGVYIVSNTLEKRLLHEIINEFELENLSQNTIFYYDSLIKTNTPLNLLRYISNELKCSQLYI